MPRTSFLPAVRLSPDEWAMLTVLAQDRGLDVHEHGTKSQIIRTLIREAHSRRVPLCPRCGNPLQLHRLPQSAISFGPIDPRTAPAQSALFTFSFAWVCPQCGHEDTYPGGPPDPEITP